MQLLHLLIPKHRKIDFEISILIRDLANVPLVSGLYFVRWRIQNASHASGYTARAPIKDHCIYWNHVINTMAQLVIDKRHVLGACELKLDIYQEVSAGKETRLIGSLCINLSEYANNGVTTRRYLLDNCKFNSTLKLLVRMNQKSDLGVHYQTPKAKGPVISTDQLFMINDRNDKSPLSDERSILAESVRTATTSKHSSPFSIETPKRSQSATDLLHYCNTYTTYSHPGEPSPTDLVEQFFSCHTNKLPSLTGRPV